MKILFLAPYTPTLIRVRPFQLLRTLVKRGNEVTLATLWASEAEFAELQSMRDDGIRVVAQRLSQWRALGNTLLAVPTGKPLQSAYCWQPALAAQLRRLLEEEHFDVVHVEHLRGARYGLLVKPLQPRGKPIPVVWDSVDSISHLFEQAAQESRSLKGRLMTQLDLARTRRYEGMLVHQFAQVVVTSPTDKAVFKRLASQQAIGNDAPCAHLHVLPNGVDLDYFAPGEDERAPATLVFSGKMSYHANITAATYLVNEIMPHIWTHRPDVNAWIVGKDPTPPVRALASKGVPRRGAVLVTGTVPDIRPYLQHSTLAVAPVPYGAGIQNKVLEAMACATPVVASPQACSALQVEPERDLIVRQDAPSFARAVLHLLDHPAQRQRLGAAARSYVEQNHSWNTIVEGLEAIYAAAIAESLKHPG
jgi:sugar transferase (PEP-CTERM/EpsH1 system associated)